MSSLRELRLKTSYRKGDADIASGFYVPCMANAKSYDRAVGFFSCSVYAVAWAGLKQFVENSGKMRIICSPVLSPDDASALVEGYEDRVALQVGEKLRAEIEEILESKSFGVPAKVLASLVALGVIDLRVALLPRSSGEAWQRLYHDKVGIFRDTSGNCVVFKGSMNETWNGLANDGNLESVDVFVSWAEARERERVRTECEYFDRLWENKFDGAIVRKFPEVAEKVLVRAASRDHWEQMLDEVTAAILETEAVKGKREDGRKPRKHQADALENWEKAGRRGIFEHATGSGKTFTALCAARKALDAGEVVVVLVPSTEMLNQWREEVGEFFGDDVDVLRCGGGNGTWRSQLLLKAWTRHRDGGAPKRLIIATLQTANSAEFLGLLEQGEHLCVICDEVHRIGSEGCAGILAISAGARLGLSATPRRCGDEPGNERIRSFFGEVVPPVYTIRDAIPESLTPYFYYVHTVVLNESEKTEWSNITNKILRLVARSRSEEGKDNRNLVRQLEMLYFARARIVKQAEEKVEAAVNVLRNRFERGQKWLVYCDDQEQLGRVMRRCGECGLPTMEFHSAMAGDRKQTIALLDVNGGIVVSIRCLDEGVNIPSVTHALILASSKNPREFIQRRGRVLRKAPGKYLAHVHDVIVLPGEDATEEVSIIEGELARAIEFGRWADNPASVADLERIALTYYIDLESAKEVGNEDDTND